MKESKDSKSGSGSAGTADGPAGVEVKTTESGAVYRKGNQSFSLDYYTGKNPVLILRCAKESPSYQQYQKDLQQLQPELKKHDVVVVEITGYESAQIHGFRALNIAEIHDLHDRYGGSPTSRVLFLIGKDGKMLVKQENTLEVAKALELLEAPQ
jgi:hypothetical protein